MPAPTPSTMLAQTGSTLVPVLRDPDSPASEFEFLSGVMLDGTDLADALDFRATLRSAAQFGRSSADAETAAWLAGDDLSVDAYDVFA